MKKSRKDSIFFWNILFNQIFQKKIESLEYILKFDFLERYLYVF